MVERRIVCGCPAWSPYSTLAWTARGIAHAPALRQALIAAVERKLRRRAAATEVRQPAAVTEDKLAMSLALLNIADRALAEGLLGNASLRGLMDRLLYDVIVQKGDERAKHAFRERHGANPPAFLTLSPGKTCNLRCVGCYADAGPTAERLPWDTLNRIVQDARDQWSARFFVISGGEPFACRDGGRGILDLAERHPECFFITYTNGTLITDAVAKQLGALGNLSPSLSVEGLCSTTCRSVAHPASI